jgi:unsaturated chondroitin disaccharide hydrolase
VKTPGKFLKPERWVNPAFMWMLLFLLMFTFAQRLLPDQQLDNLVNDAIRVSLVHLERSVAEVGDSTLFPTYGTPQLKWKLDDARQWTAGFYPGCLWYAYELSNDPRFEHWARRWTSALRQEKGNTETHDLGFKFMCSFGNGLRLGPARDRSRYREVLLGAANTLSQRYTPEVGCLSSNWDKLAVENSVPVIIDVMMNLELLYWASQNGDPFYYAEYATNHALTTARDFVRPDGSTFHIVRYNKYTGKVINKGTIQGAGDSTTWSRGQAWGLYGMVVVYRYTKDRRFLDVAVRLTNYFLSHLPDDHVSRWDFQSEIDKRDVSATCIVASALFELIDDLENDSLRQRYRSAAEGMLSSLCHAPYFTGGRDTSCLLDHSTHHLPMNSNVDVPSIFADYYFLEALVRYRAHRGIR